MLAETFGEVRAVDGRESADKLTLPLPVLPVLPVHVAVLSTIYCTHRLKGERPRTGKVSGKVGGSGNLTC